jgi:hypothetical protein
MLTEELMTINFTLSKKLITEKSGLTLTSSYKRLMINIIGKTFKVVETKMET